MYLTFRDMTSAPNVALVTPLENFPTLFRPTRAMFEANAAPLQVLQFLLPRIQRNVQLRHPQQPHSPRQILLPSQRHRRHRPLVPHLLR